MENSKTPAFPQHWQSKVAIEDQIHEVGLTKLEYFALNAPSEIPAWFKHTPLEKPKEPKHWSEFSDQDPFKKDLQAWHYDPIFDLPEEVSFYQIAWRQHWHDLHKWNEKNNISRYFQWRKYFAELTLKTLEE
jgi:hypothetical protein